MLPRFSKNSLWCMLSFLKGYKKLDMTLRLIASLFFATCLSIGLFMMMLISFSNFLAIYSWSTYTCFFQPCSLIQNYKTHMSIITLVKQNTRFVTPLHQLLSHHWKKKCPNWRISSMEFWTSSLFEMQIFINYYIESSFFN